MHEYPQSFLNTKQSLFVLIPALATPNFSDIMEVAISQESEQMEEIKDIISKILVEKRRVSFLKNHQDAIKDAAEGKPFSSDNPTKIAHC